MRPISGKFRKTARFVCMASAVAIKAKITTNPKGTQKMGNARAVTAQRANRANRMLKIRVRMAE
jgi:hypothetical protein